MTRRTLFLAAIMVLASLGAGAQSTPQKNSAPQPDTVQQTNNNASQSTASQPSQTAAQATASKEQTPAVSNGQLPQTSTILPLLGLIGLGSLVAGFFARR
jgi:hypothetical protein